MKTTRYSVLDAIRGLALFSMILYHAVWDLVYIFHFPWNWYQSTSAFLWQQSICFTFIILSGFCQPLGRHRTKRGLVVFFSGFLISAATILIMPQNRVLFGVLTLIGSCMLLILPLENILQKCSPVSGWILSILLFILIRISDWSSIGALIQPLRIRHPLIDLFFSYLGLPSANFYSTDYFPLFPWIFLFLSGYYLYHIFLKWNLLRYLKHSFLKPLEWIGSHTLIIYMLHQPVLYGLFTLILNTNG